MALIWVKKAGKNGGVFEKNYWIFRRGAQTGDPFRSMALKIYL